MSWLALLACVSTTPDSPTPPDSVADTQDTSPDPIGGVGSLEQSHRRGFYDAPFDLELLTEWDDGRIVYTLDGTDPTVQGLDYTGPIRLDATAVVRAALVSANGVVVDQDTHTYFFAASVPDQVAPADYPDQWWVNDIDGPFPADYAVDSEIVTHPDYAEAFPGVWTQLPVLSVILHPDDLFGRTGIHENPLDSGENWERAAHVELLDPHDDARTFGAGCGLRIAGGSSRIPARSPKKSFRLTFKSEFGPASLEEPIFDATDATGVFETLVLRGRYNRSWVHYDPIQRARADYVREQLSTDLQRAMGTPSPHTRSVHLFLNGLYWGLYVIEERPDEHFMHAYFGGDTDTWDVLNQGELRNGTTDAWEGLLAAAAQDLSDDANAQVVLDQLDVDSLLDYVLLQLYSGNNDWPDRNWYGSHHPDEGLWRFFSWDTEITWILDTTDVVHRMSEHPDNPGGVFLAIMDNEEVRLRYADRMQLHLYGGALEPDDVIQRWVDLYDQVAPGVLGESARWGDHIRDDRLDPEGQLYTVNDHWLVERDRVVDHVMGTRRELFVDQMRGYGWFPSYDAPSVSVDGVVTVSGKGMIFYTQDGTDPRLPGGAVSESATQYAEPFSPTGDAVWVRSRRQGEWSALVQVPL